MGMDLSLLLSGSQGYTADSRFRSLYKAAKKGAASDDADDDIDDEDDDDDATGRGKNRDSSDDDDDDDDTDDDDDSDDDDADDSDEDEDDDDEDSGRTRFKAPKSQAELDRIIEKRLARDRKATERKLRQKIKDEEELSEAKDNKDYKRVAEKLEAELQEIRDTLAVTQRNDLKARVAKRLGLPDAIADRLQGETEAKMLADGKRLRKELGLTKGSNADTDVGQSNSAGPRNKRRKATDEDKEDWQKPGYFTQT